MPWPDYWPKPADHKMHNLGALWSCEVCHACIRVAAKKFPQKLLNPCKGMPRRRVGGFGLLMPTPGPSLLPDRPTPQARVRQNKPKAKAGASLKLGSLFKPSRSDPSVCSQGKRPRVQVVQRRLRVCSTRHVCMYAHHRHCQDNGGGCLFGSGFDSRVQELCTL